MLIDLNELKGIDFSKKYYDPSKLFLIEDESYKFCSEPVGDWGLKYKFNSASYNSCFSTSDVSIFQIFKQEHDKMLLNDYRISLIRDLFSRYDNVNFIDLFHDLKDDYFFHYEDYFLDENYSIVLSEYKNVLKKYGIHAKKKELEYLLYFIYSPDINKDILCNDYDFDALLKEKIEDSENFSFKLDYIYYLILVNSQHNNVLDKHHFFDVGNNDGSDYLCFMDVCFPIEIIKEIALKKGHIIDGKGLGILRYKSSVKELKIVIEKYGLKKSGNKEVLIKRIEDNLTKNQINKEFNGSRFILTKEGEKFLDKFKNFRFDYFDALPECFETSELDLLCKENPQYPIEDIIYSIVMEDWCQIENPDAFSEECFYSLIYDIHRARYYLAESFEYEFPERAIHIYTSCLNEVLDFDYLEKLCELYNAQGLDDEKFAFLSRHIEKINNDIECNANKFNETQRKNYLSKIFDLLDEIQKFTSEEYILDIVDDLRRIFKKISRVSKNKGRIIKYYDELYWDEYYDIIENQEVLDKIKEIHNLSNDIHTIFFNYELNQLERDLEQLNIIASQQGLIL